MSFMEHLPDAQVFRIDSSALVYDPRTVDLKRELDDIQESAFGEWMRANRIAYEVVASDTTDTDDLFFYVIVFDKADAVKVKLMFG